MCDDFITIKDFFETYGTNTKLNCEMRYNIVENVLGEFWADYATLPWNTQSFPIISGSHNYIVNTPIRDIEGFYSSCKLACNSCYEVIPNGCGSNTYRLKMQPTLNSGFLLKGEYDFCMDGKSITAHLPDGIKNGYVRYFKSYSLDKGLGDLNKIPIPKSMMYLFKKLIAKEYALLSGDMYQGIDQMYANEFRQGMDKIKDRASRQVHYLEGPVDADAVGFEASGNISSYHNDIY